MKAPFTLFILLFFSQMGFAQELSGIVLSNYQKPVAGATVAIHNLPDSSFVKFAVTNTNGEFSAIVPSHGDYLLIISTSGFEKKYEIVKTSQVAPSIILYGSSKTLDAVRVTSNKQPLIVRADRIVFNVDANPASAGSNVFETISRLPGIIVDNEENISAAGKNGVRVYIDGKKSPLTEKDLANYLKALQSSQIESIEIITQPGAKYEAEGNAAIISIKLKRNTSFGTNANVNAGLAYSKSLKSNAGLTINNRNKRTNLFGSFNYNYQKNEAYLDLYKTAQDSVFDQKGDVVFDVEAFSYGGGIDYFAGPKSTVRFEYTGSTQNFGNDKIVTTNIYKPGFVIDRKLVSDNSVDVNAINNSFAGGYKYSDTLGTEFTIDADYSTYKKRSSQFQPNKYYDATGENLLYSNDYYFYFPTDIKLITAKSDFEKNIKNAKISLGIYSSFANTDNDFFRYNVSGNLRILDSSRSNKFSYKENISAAYFSFSKTVEKFGITAGLRLENNISEGRSTGKQTINQFDTTFKFSNFNVFPSASISYSLNKNNRLTLSYFKRVDRPAYADLNPFEFKLDEYTFQKGNPDLKPQYTNSISLNNIYKGKLSTTISYSRTDDVFAFLADSSEKTKTVLIRRNLSRQDLVSFVITYPLHIKNYNAFIYANSYYSHFKGNLGLGRDFDIETYTVLFNIQQGYRLPQNINLQLSAWFNSPSIWQGGLKSKSMGSVDFGISKAIFKGNGTLKLAVTDIFKTIKYNSKSNFAGQDIVVKSGTPESRMVKADLSIRFGNKKLKAVNSTKSADEQKKRLQSSGIF